MKRKKLILLIISLATVLAAVIFAAAYFITQRVSYDATIKTPGLNGPITIQRSKNGTPLIEAHSKEDIYLALGYLHAQDRFIVLEYFRAIATGSISSIIDDDGAKLEKIVNIAGIRSRAEKIAAELEAPYSEMLNAYARGINLIRHQWFHSSISQRDWTSKDVIAILLLREWGHAFLQNRELFFPVPQQKNKWALHEIIPKDLLKAYDESETPSIQLLLEIRRLVEQYIGTFCEGFAFALPAGTSPRELVRSAFSLNSSMNIYPGWYPVKIKFGDINIFGISQAGLPFIFEGNSQNISFYGFNLNTDTQDFFVEKTRDTNGILKYLSAAGWREFKSLREPAFGFENTERHDVVWHTDNGPLLSNLFGKNMESEISISMKYVLPDKSYIISLFDIPFSESIETAVKSVRRVNSLPRVYLFTSSTQTVKTYSGMMPRRPQSAAVLKKGLWNGWQGSLDLSAYQSRDMRKAVTGSSFLQDAPPMLRNYSNINETRYQRLANLLMKQRITITDKKIQKILKDVYSLRAEKFTPEFIKLLQPNPVTSARLTRIYFKEWNFSMERKEVAPLIFERLLYNYISETVSDELPFLKKQIDIHFHLLEDNFHKMLTAKGSMFFDDQYTENIENREAIFDRAFLKTMRWLSRQQGPIMDSWRWGKIHRGHYRIPIEEKTLSSRYIYEINDIALDGSSGTIFNGSSHKDLTPGCSTAVVGILDNRTVKVAVDFAYSVNPMSQFYYGREISPKFHDLTKAANEHKAILVPIEKK